MQREQQELISDAARNSGKKGAPLPPPRMPPPRLGPGIIFDMHQGPFSPLDFAVYDFWQGPVGSNWELAYAGLERGAAHPSGPRGALRLYIETPDQWGGLHLSFLGEFVPPTDSGGLKIVSTHAEGLGVQSDGGHAYVFNLQNNTFVS